MAISFAKSASVFERSFLAFDTFLARIIMMSRSIAIVFLATFVLLLAGCPEPLVVKMFEGNKSEEVQLGNEVAKFLIIEGFGHEVEFVSGKASPEKPFDQQVDVALQFPGETPINFDSLRPMNDRANLPKAIARSFKQKFPTLTDFIDKISFSKSLMARTLRWKASNDASFDLAALYFLANSKSKWKKWLPEAEYHAAANALEREIKKQKTAGHEFNIFGFLR